MAPAGRINVTTSIIFPFHWSAALDQHRRNVAQRTGNLPVQTDVLREALYTFLIAQGFDLTAPGEQP